MHKTFSRSQVCWTKRRRHAKREIKRLLRFLFWLLSPLASATLSGDCDGDKHYWWWCFDMIMMMIVKLGLLKMWNLITLSPIAFGLIWWMTTENQKKWIFLSFPESVVMWDEISFQGWVQIFFENVTLKFDLKKGSKSFLGMSYFSWVTVNHSDWLFWTNTSVLQITFM